MNGITYAAIAIIVLITFSLGFCATQNQSVANSTQQNNVSNVTRTPESEQSTNPCPCCATQNSSTDNSSEPLINASNVTQTADFGNSTNLSNYVTQPTTPSITSKKDYFRSDEEPEFIVEYSNEAELFGLGATAAAQAAPVTVDAAVYDASGKRTDIKPKIDRIQENKFAITVPRERASRAGLYTLAVELVKDESVYVEALEFPWGLVSLNTRKSIYKPGETAEFIIVVLDHEGHPVCGANLSLAVTNPNNETKAISTLEGTITAGAECGIYHANYTTALEGNHTINITAAILGTDVSFTTHFLVQKAYDFEIVRTAQSKIDPTKQDWFNVTIDIERFTTASSVTIKEFVPAEFTIVSDATEIVQEDDTKTLMWKKEIIENKTSVSYSYAVPHIWPYLYTLGPVKIDYDALTFEEARPWYVAVDPTTDKFVANVSHSGTVYADASSYTGAGIGYFNFDDEKIAGMGTAGTGRLFEGYFKFDTASIPDNAVIQNATLYVFLNNENTESGDGTAEVYSCDYGATLDTGDFQTTKGTYQGTLFEYDSATGQYHGLSINTASISKTSYTEFCVYAENPVGTEWSFRDEGDNWKNGLAPGEAAYLNVTYESDIQSPVINLESPENNATNTTTRTPDFVFTATDDYASTLSCQLFINKTDIGTGVPQCYGENTSVVNGTSTTITANASLANGNYDWWINCSDGANENQSEVRNLSINNPAPTITLNSPENESVISTSYTLLNATVTNPNGDDTTVPIFGGNSTSDLTTRDGLLYMGENVASGSDLAYNFTARPIQSDEAGLIMLMHCDNLSEYGENATLAYDFSDSGNNGTCSGSSCPTFNSTGGKFAGALEFDGLDDSIKCGNDTSLNITNTITLEAWLKPGASGTLYNRTITLNPATPEADYQLNIELNMSNFNYSNANPSGNDIRFYNASGSSLHYWIESWNTGGSSTLWVRIPTSGTSIVYMQYGNISGSPASNGTDTFELFDDFDGGTIFSTSSQPYGDPTVCGAGAPNSADHSNTGTEQLIELGCYDEGELRASPNLASSSYALTVKWRSGNDNFEYNGTVYTHYDEEYGASACTPNRLIVVNGNEIYEKFGQLSSYNEMKTVTFTGALTNFYLSTGSSGGSVKYYTYYDYTFIRKYNASNHPDATVGSETEIPINDAISVTCKNGSYQLAGNLTSVSASINSNEISASLDSGWNHIALTYDKDASSNQQKLYVNGVLQAQNNLSDQINTTANNLTIGYSGDPIAISSTIDEVAIYNRSLSASEILNHYRLDEGTYYWKVNATDGFLSNESETRQFTISSPGNQAPNIALNTPPNGSSTSNNWAVLNATVTDADNDTTTVYFYANNNSNGLNASEGLVYSAENVANGTSVTYNLTALPLKSSEEGLALLLHFDNRSEYGENGTYAYDFSANGNNGTVYGSALWNISAGKFGGAFELDSDNDYVDCGNDESLNLTGNMSIEAWVKQNEYKQQYYVQKYDGSNGFIFAPYWNSPYKKIRLYVNGPEGGGSRLSDIDLSLNQWTHIAGTFSPGQIHIYINGELHDGSIEGTIPNSIYSSTSAVLIGRYGANYYNGSLDDVAIYNRTLSAEEIATHYQLGEGTYYWKGNASDGSLTNESDVWQFTVGEGYSSVLELRNQTDASSVTSINFSGLSGTTLDNPYNDVDGSSAPQNRTGKIPVVTIYNPSSNTYKIYLKVEAGTGWTTIIDDETFNVTEDNTDPGAVSGWTSLKSGGSWGEIVDTGATVAADSCKDLYQAFSLKESGTGSSTLSVLGEVV